MKRLLALILAGIMLLAITSCQKNDNGNNDGDSTEEPRTLEGVKEPVDVLNAIWSTYNENEKFPIMGGDFNVDNLVDGAPGRFDITDINALSAQLVCPENAVNMVEEAASMSHSMNANTFTGAAYRLKNDDDMEKFSSVMLNSIKNNTWICGFPDKVMVAELAQGYVVVCFGKDGDEKIFTTFKNKLLSVYDFADVKVDSVQ